MFTLTRLLTVREMLAGQVPALTVSIAVAEVFYKFHSFTLECLAFLATWYLTDLLIRGPGLVRRALAARTDQQQAS